MLDQEFPDTFRRHSHVNLERLLKGDIIVEYVGSRAQHIPYAHRIHHIFLSFRDIAVAYYRAIAGNVPGIRGCFTSRI